VARALGLKPGDVVVSLGTSGTAFAVSEVPAHDATGTVAGFADATGHFLPLVCTLNAARIMTSTAAMLGVDLDEYAALALSASPGSDGLVLLPYFDGERTPNLPEARGSIHGVTRANFTSANMARASIEGMLGGLADAVDALEAVGVQIGRVLIVGGAAANTAVGPIAATMFTVPVIVPPAGEYVADGAARQAAWVATQQLPQWEADGTTAVFDPQPVSSIRDNYAAARISLFS
jgi:xylulokinase